MSNASLNLSGVLVSGMPPVAMGYVKPASHTLRAGSG